MARQLRADSIRCTTRAGSGHPTSCLSAADLMAVLLCSYFKYDLADPRHPNNDRLIFSKGHAAPLLYSFYKAAGAVSDDELLSLRQFGSEIEGHPTPRFRHVPAATGSLGQGIGVATGIALAGAHIGQLPFRVWTLLGDAEMSEGSVYEAMAAAARYRLNNLIAIIDVNRLGQAGPTPLQWDTQSYRARVEAFGWQSVEINGHDHDEIDAAFARACAADRPTCVIARTEKGRGVSFAANAEGWHGRALTADEEHRALEELRAPSDIVVRPGSPGLIPSKTAAPSRAYAPPTYEFGSRVATRQAYGNALVALGDARADVFALDADVCNSTCSELFKKAYPHRFFEMSISEQLMVGIATGLGLHGERIAFASTFAAFMTRAFDQIRMAAVSRADLRLCGSHCGVSVGEDGPSQMGLEDIALFRAVHGSAVLYPCDAVSTASLVGEMALRRGISYLRTTRAKTPVIYRSEERFPIGGSKTLRVSEHDQGCIVAAGITVAEALTAADTLADEGINVRVIDLYSVKPIDAAALVRAARETQHVIVVEDHWAWGGIGDAVASALAEDEAHCRFTHLAIRSMPQSGKPEELLDHYGISAPHIVNAVHSYLPSPA